MNEAVYKAIGELLREQKELSESQLKELEGRVFETISTIQLKHGQDGQDGKDTGPIQHPSHRSFPISTASRWWCYVPSTCPFFRRTLLTLLCH